MDSLIGLFPIPILVARGAIPTDLVAALIRQFDAAATGPNVRTALLSHTPMAAPRSHENFTAVLSHVAPKLTSYGEALLGEALNWGVKEIWINRMEPGGAQKMHNHANSFISGILYLSEVDASAATVFHRHTSHTSFLLQNENERCRFGQYNSPVYKMPEAAPGDLVLFPSYMMHEVPPNQGGVRYTAAFNALPERLDSWGYTVRFR